MTMTLAQRQRVARQARKHPTYCAAGVHVFQQQHELSDEQLAAWLGCDLEQLYTLCLCGIPMTLARVERMLVYISAERIDHLFQLLCFLIAQATCIGD